MAQLTYTAVGSLDGYIADVDGNFDFAAPDAELHAHVNATEGGVGTYLLGRRTYELMTYWDTASTGEDVPAVEREFTELWQATDKVVYSRTLENVDAPRTRLERDFDVDAVRSLVAAADRDVSIGGPVLAAHAIRAGLVDTFHMYVAPTIVGGGLRGLPDGVRLDLELVDERRFAGGTVYLRYVPRR
ncbi:bifunctional deaminase-reductase domain protein [Beutenbergia cavernae DSM 12333]|uniref:Bifunctional deaminase-reductase domain protein n=1 Tax=Beutenbergia cavernae (strain ATCC BAA-8 / DSM 12333 / CCUG 43141 / JCM 11478 / NBRC 16432 / NCIMB 13614 / HKI 0122) TaxID=471853 RepID=C5BVM9_BEUC1|nr:dihydrofolate reductase family protein [Beutenbergia cavernae]ACQ78469.1 bifunctional deaminase-reductase domain protein [Beutenbergia cavernae DSM 12333]